MVIPHHSDEIEGFVGMNFDHVLARPARFGRSGRRRLSRTSWASNNSTSWASNRTRTHGRLTRFGRFARFGPPGRRRLGNF